MNDSLLVALLIELIIVHLEAFNNQPQHQYIALMKYNFFEFQLDDMNDETQHHYMQ